VLHERSPELFDTWFGMDLYERVQGVQQAPFYYLTLLPWYGWPLWAVGLWTLWQSRHNPSTRAALTLPLLGFLITLAALFAPVDKRELYALPLLIPMTLLAAPAADGLRRGAANAWYWFSVMGFTFAIVVGWFYWLALEIGVPARLHQHLHELQPGYAPGFRTLPFALGAAYTLTWFAVLWGVKRTQERPAVIWAVGVTVVWSLLAILFIGWVDTGKSYRSVMLGLRSALPAQHRCIASRGLGDAQRAMLHYYIGVITRREESDRTARNCDLLLVQSRPGEEHGLPRAWQKLWEGQRPGDRSERYYLYRRARR
jgi:hypothetical protein